MLTVSGIEQAFDDIRSATYEEINDVFYDLLRRAIITLKQNNPYDTGRSQGSWQVSAVSPEFYDAVPPPGADRTDIRERVDFFDYDPQGLRLEDRLFFFTNGTPYIERIEFEYPAHLGFVRHSLYEVFGEVPAIEVWDIPEPERSD